MAKRYITLAIVYAVLALIFGVFYRELTKYAQYAGETALSVIHPHYLGLGTMGFLLLTLLEKSFGFSQQKKVRILLIAYQAGLNLTVLGLLIRGLTQVWGTALSSGLDASISGVAGLGHAVLGVSLVWLLFVIRKQAVFKERAE